MSTLARLIGAPPDRAALPCIFDRVQRSGVLWALTLAALLAGCGGSSVRNPWDEDGGADDDEVSAPPGQSVGAGAGTGTGASNTGSTASGVGASGSGGAGISGVLETEVEAQHVVSDPVRGVFYATVAGDAPSHPNSLVVVDQTGTVVASVFIGSQPSTMALSDDASTLWVSLRGSYEIRRVDLGSGSPLPGSQYTLPPGDWGDLGFADPMVVLPNTTGSVAVSLHTTEFSPSYLGTAIVDDGVARPEQLPGHTGASRLTGGPDGWLFGFNNQHTGFEFFAVGVTPTGVNATEHVDLVSGFYTDIVYAAGRVYATSGEVVNVSTPSAPKKAGQFSFSGTAVLPFVSEARLMMLSAGFSEPARLRLLDTDTFALVDEADLGVQLEWAVDLAAVDKAAGGRVLAFTGPTSYDTPPKLYLLESPF